MERLFYRAIALKTACLIALSIVCMAYSSDTADCAAQGYQILTASYYDISSLKRDGQWAITHGRCSDGSYFKDEGFTGAYWGVPLGTFVRVVDLQSHRSIIIKITDRTNRRFAKTRIDLSRAAFSALADGRLDRGLLSVIVEKI